MKKLLSLFVGLCLLIPLNATVLPPNTINQNNEVKKMLTGKWETPTQCLRFDFFENGDYLKYCQGNARALEERGTWDVSANGEELILYPRKTAIPERIGIKFLQMSEMVLDIKTEQKLPDGMDGHNVYFNRN